MTDDVTPSSWYFDPVSLPRPVLRAALCASLLLPLSACYGDAESFAKKSAKLYCQRLEACYRAQFEDRFNGDLERCRDDLYTDVLDFDDQQNNRNCEYDPDRGKQCIDTLRETKDDCSNDADQLIIDDCAGNPISAAFLQPAEVYHCSAPQEAAPSDESPDELAAPEPASFPEDDPAATIPESGRSSP